MGVPRFFRWIQRKFPYVCRNIQLSDREVVRQVVPYRIDNLYIDMNGLFHPCAQKIYQYGDFEPRERLLHSDAKTPSLSELEIPMFQEVCGTVEKILYLVNPRRRLILCVDGVAGAAKQTQQRKRRYRSGSSRTEGKFDSNCMTPGTRFMRRLNTYIEYYIHWKVSTDPRWQHTVDGIKKTPFEVIFSNEKVPGEGEHKIIRYMRNRIRCGDPYVIHESHCIHGLDADLMMLSLALHLPRIFLFREDRFDRNNDFHFVEIPRLYKGLGERLNHPNKRCSVNDFIVACFLLGNDFVPHSPVLRIEDEMMKILMEGLNLIYSEGLSLTCGDEEPTIRREGLQRFLTFIGNQEQEILDATEKRNRPLLKEATRFLESGEEHVLLAKYKESFYREKLHASSEEEKRRIADHYLEALQWILQYYHTSVPPSWDWYYPYLYTPFPSDLADASEQWVPTDWRPSKALTPYEQLLCVLPPSSRNLIPKPYWGLITRDDSPVIDLFPKEFAIDSDGVKYDWEATPLLPFVDLQRIRDANLEVVRHLKRPMRGNQEGSHWSYRLGTRLDYVYQTSFGTVEHCRCLKKKIEF